MKKEYFYVFWLSFKDGRKHVSSCVYPDRSSAVGAALNAISMYEGLDLLSSDYPFYVGCYEY